MNAKRILLDHGAGGRASHELVSELFLKYFAGQNVASLEDSTLIDVSAGKLAFSTDSFVVTPIFFPGGDIGELAVCGTVNDVAMRGARPLWLSAGFIIEEGLEVEILEKIVASMAEAARKAGVRIVAGDTKVVPKGAADKIFINTAGIGVVPDGIDVSAVNARPGDAIILSGTMGDHGMAVLCQREGLNLESQIRSDAAPLNHLVETILKAAPQGAVHVLRDPTRGGVGTTLNEIAVSSNVGILLEESRLPVTEAVRGACDVLGLDPLYVANEGKLLAFIDPAAAETVLTAVRNHEYGRDARIIGQTTNDRPGKVFLKTVIGGQRIIDMLTGEQLPRIC